MNLNSVPLRPEVDGMGCNPRTVREDVKPARLACATVPAYARDSKWSPAPTVGHTG